MDPILYWNEVATEADRTTHTPVAPSEAGGQGPAGSSRALAIVHLAMHDAYFSINPKYSTYLANLPAVPSGADGNSTIAGAAHATLSALYPTQQAFFNARHAAEGMPGGQSGADGHAFGQAVAAKILADRQNDPALGADGTPIRSLVGTTGRTRTTPSQGFYAPFYGSRSRSGDCECNSPSTHGPAASPFYAIANSH